MAGFVFLYLEIQKVKDNNVTEPQQNSVSQVNSNAVNYDQINAYIDQKIGQLETTQEQQVFQTPAPTSKPAIATTAKQITFIPISNSGSTTETDWVDVAGSDFYIALQDYPNASSVTFEATIKIANASGYGYARLFDVTHGFAVSGSEVSTASADYSVVSSGNLNLWSGNNLYRVQVKSQTSQQASFASGRVKIIY